MRSRRSGVRRQIHGLAGAAFWLGLAAVWTLPAAAARVEKAGISIDFSVHNLDGDEGKPGVLVGDDLLVRFRISDAKTGYPVSELHPAAWVSPREPGKPKPDLKACKSKIGTLAQLGISHADEDLNSYYILTLNLDDTIAVINPVVNLSTSNLKSLVHLGGKAGAWTFDERTALAYVTLPGNGQVAVVDIIAGEVRRHLAVGAMPRAVAIQPDGRYIWVGNDGAGTVSVISSDGSSVLKNLEVGDGPIHLSFDERGRFAFVAAEGAGRVAVVDVATLAVIRSVAVGSGRLRMAYSKLSQALYVLNAASHELTVAQVDSGRIVKTLTLPDGAQNIGITPQGDFALVLDPAERAIVVLDTATSAVVRALRLPEAPTHMLFSAIYAYVYHAASSNVTLVQLSGLDDLSAPPVVSIPMGLARPGEEFTRSGLLPMALLPEEGGAVIANPVEKVIYFYNDGMMYPMGSFKTYTANPLGVILYDRSLQERRLAGVYETNLRIDQPGMYDVPFVLPSPSVVTCFELEVGADEKFALAPKPPVFEERFGHEVFTEGEPATLRFALRDARTGKPIEGLEDVRLMSFRLGRNWSARRSARPLGDGVYEAVVTFPAAGEYKVLVEVPSRGIRFGDIRHVDARVVAAVEESQPGAIDPAVRGGTP